ncbi:minor capsid protein [Tissierella sp.]|uniref:minor capsid protein n=1 Tax=Tissierella sp. TaxID=41274 RepID=UPI00285C59CA|nr:minor capsid protein [Tissierella sp.]MDR7856313.1 minor capsid protein [Tissierella sp.]
MPKDKSYWEKRQEQRYLAGEKTINEYYKGLENAFEQAKDEIDNVINKFYIRYSKDNNLTYAMAQIKLDSIGIKSLKNYINKINDSLGEYSLELKNMSVNARITRYQALQMQIEAILQQLYSIEYEHNGEKLLKEVYSDSYYRTWYNIDVYKGFHSEFAQIDPRTVEELIKYPFNGANFSTRLWKQKDHMLQQLTESLTTMLIQGKHPSTLSKAFAKKFSTKEFEAYRLLHTEGSFIIEQGTLAAYKEDGVEKYKILATLDHRTSETCRGQDGEVHEIEELIVGENYPPFHYLCRTTTIPDYEDMEIGTRAARNSEGKTYKVPADMKYPEWLEKYGY